MNVFLIIRFNEASLSISVLATLYHLIGSLITNDKFQLDSSLSGWYCGSNEISTSDHLIILPGSMR
jgi:hypothetical protein